MIGIGTLINTGAIVAGGLLGLVSGKSMKERMQDSLLKVCGVSIVFAGIAGAMEKMLTINDGVISAGQTMLVTICLGLGTFLGEVLDIEALFEKFGEWLKIKTHNTGDPKFVDGFVTASLTVSVGAMAIVGAVQDGILGDWSTLATKSVLDFILALVMTCSMGKGCIFSAIPVFVFEGTMTLGAIAIKPLMTDLALDYISLIGSIIIFCVGVNIMYGKQFRAANMIPAIFIAVIAAFLPL